MKLRNIDEQAKLLLRKASTIQARVVTRVNRVREDLNDLEHYINQLDDFQNMIIQLQARIEKDEELLEVRRNKIIQQNYEKANITNEESIEVLDHIIDEIATMMNASKKFVIKTRTRPCVNYRHAVIYVFVDRGMMKTQSIATYMSIDSIS